MRISLVAMLITVLLAACSSEQLYASGRNAQRTECMKQADSAAREQCLKDAGMPQDAYQKEVDAARK